MVGDGSRVIGIETALCAGTDLRWNDRTATVPWTMAVVGGYLATLVGLKSHLLTLEPFVAFRLVSQVIGGSSLLLFVIAAWLTWGPRGQRMKDEV